MDSSDSKSARRVWPKFANETKDDGGFSKELANIEAREPKYTMKRIQTPKPKKVIFYDTTTLEKIEFSSCKGE
jgi:hypothetical protein